MSPFITAHLLGLVNVESFLQKCESRGMFTTGSARPSEGGGTTHHS